MSLYSLAPYLPAEGLGLQGGGWKAGSYTGISAHLPPSLSSHLSFPPSLSPSSFPLLLSGGSYFGFETGSQNVVGGFTSSVLLPLPPGCRITGIPHYAPGCSLVLAQTAQHLSS